MPTDHLNHLCQLKIQSLLLPRLLLHGLAFAMVNDMHLGDIWGIHLHFSPSSAKVHQDSAHHTT